MKGLSLSLGLKGGRVPYGPELIVNGDFTSATGWTPPTETSISGGKANFTATTALRTITRSLTAVVGQRYRVTFTIDSISAGAVRASFGGVTFTNRTLPGTYAVDVVALSATTNAGLGGITGTTAVADNFSIKQIL